MLTQCQVQGKPSQTWVLLLLRERRGKRLFSAWVGGGTGVEVSLSHSPIIQSSGLFFHVVPEAKDLMHLFTRENTEAPDEVETLWPGGHPRILQETQEGNPVLSSRQRFQANSNKAPQKQPSHIPCLPDHMLCPDPNSYLEIALDLSRLFGPAVF